jgi:hypothetical protein
VRCTLCSVPREESNDGQEPSVTPDRCTLLLPPVSGFTLVTPGRPTLGAGARVSAPGRNRPVRPATADVWCGSKPDSRRPSAQRPESVANQPPSGRRPSDWFWLQRRRREQRDQGVGVGRALTGAHARGSATHGDARSLGHFVRGHAWVGHGVKPRRDTVARQGRSSTPGPAPISLSQIRPSSRTSRVGDS